MDKNAFNILRNMAYSAFSETYAGLYTMLQTNPSFLKELEKNYRLKSFEQTHEFFMTSNEKNFHFMGFLDAILWFQRSGYLKNTKATLDIERLKFDDEEDKQATVEAIKEGKAINSFIISYEVGDE